MTLEERVARLEHRIEQLDRIERELTGLRADLRVAFERIFASLDELNRKPGFRWPWESRKAT